MKELLRSVGLSLWFLVVGIAFFLPYLGIVLPLTPVYGIFLLVVTGVGALRILRGRSDTTDAEPLAAVEPRIAVATPTTVARPKRKEGRNRG